MDGDTDLTFLPNQALHVFEYGYAVTGYRGTYKIDPLGNITAQFPSLGHNWPVMSLQKDATSLLLVPIDGGSLVMGNRGGMTVAAGQGSYWPFRLVDSTEEARVRASIGH